MWKIYPVRLKTSFIIGKYSDMHLFITLWNHGQILLIYPLLKL